VTTLLWAFRGARPGVGTGVSAPRELGAAFRRKRRARRALLRDWRFEDAGPRPPGQADSSGTLLLVAGPRPGGIGSLAGYDLLPHLLAASPASSFRPNSRPSFLDLHPHSGFWQDGGHLGDGDCLGDGFVERSWPLARTPGWMLDPEGLPCVRCAGSCTPASRNGGAGRGFRSNPELIMGFLDCILARRAGAVRGGWLGDRAAHRRGAGEDLIAESLEEVPAIRVEGDAGIGRHPDWQAPALGRPATGRGGDDSPSTRAALGPQP